MHTLYKKFGISTSGTYVELMKSWDEWS